jgi:hypothetical protein
MVKAALAVNPNLKIVFVRYSDVTTAGNSLNSPDALIKAMEWVSNNAEKYSIDALSISQSSISVGNLSKCATEKTALNAVSSLNAKNIPTFAATGNDGSSTVIGFPSCVTGVTAIGAMGSAIELEKATNRGPGIDAVSVGKVTITKYNGVSVFDLAGSSGATVMAATSYITNNKYGTFSQYFNSLQKVVLAGIAYPYISR